MGLGCDESILSAVAKQGAGNEHFAENADTAAGLIAQECGELLSQAYLSCRLTVRLANGARKVTLRNEFAHRRIGDDLQIDLGGFQAEQMRALVLQFRPKAAVRAGRRKLATLEFDYVQASDLSEHSITHNVWAEVADSGSLETAIQVDWDVMTEVAVQRAQARKRKAMECLMIGDVERAIRRLRSAITILTDVAPHVTDGKRQEVVDEIASLREMCEDVRIDSNRSSKMLSASVADMSRGRGWRGA